MMMMIANIELRIASRAVDCTCTCTTRTTFAFDTCFIRKLAPLADKRDGFFHRTIATIDAIEHVFDVRNSYLALRVHIDTGFTGTYGSFPRDTSLKILLSNWH
jgi:hypothetical protein